MAMPYVGFGWELYKLRERRGVSQKQASTYLNISPQEYRKYEWGEMKPPMPVMIKLSRLLTVDLARLNRWIANCEAKRPMQEGDEKGGLRYWKYLEEALQKIAIYFKNEFNKELTTSQWENLRNFSRDLKKTASFSLLPMNYVLILDSIHQARLEGLKYLHDIKDFILDGEDLGGFICREMIIGPFVFFAANRTLFKNSPCKSMQDCFNRLSLSEFEELLWIAVEENGIYLSDRDIPELQQLSDFQRLCCLMVEEFKPYLPSNVDFNHLYQASLLQGIGIHAIYCLTIEGRNKASSGDETGIDLDLMQAMIYVLHPAVSAFIGARWGFPEEVLQVVLTHHDMPSKEVSSLCAMLKLINSYVNADFPTMSHEAIEELFLAYPQVSISTEVFGRVAIKMEKMKKHLYERSSSALEQASREVASFVTRKIRNTFPKKAPFPIFPESMLCLPPKRSEFRLDPGFQTTVQNVAYDRHLIFFKRMKNMRSGESYDQFLDRVGLTQIRLVYTYYQDMQEASEKLKLPSDEILARLFGK